MQIQSSSKSVTLRDKSDDYMRESMLCANFADFIINHVKNIIENLAPFLTQIDQCQSALPRMDFSITLYDNGQNSSRFCFLG